MLHMLDQLRILGHVSTRGLYNFNPSHWVNLLHDGIEKNWIVLEKISNVVCIKVLALQKPGKDLLEEELLVVYVEEMAVERSLLVFRFEKELPDEAVKPVLWETYSLGSTFVMTYWSLKLLIKSSKCVKGTHFQ